MITVGWNNILDRGLEGLSVPVRAALSDSGIVVGWRDAKTGALHVLVAGAGVEKLPGSLPAPDGARRELQVRSVDGWRIAWPLRSIATDTRDVFLASDRLTERELAAFVRMGGASMQAQLRVDETRLEIDTLSNQLADTYEELTLVYQLSSGMQVNRSPDEFFLQVCLDVIDVMQVRAMGVMLLGSNGVPQVPSLFGEVDIPPHVLARLGSDLHDQLARTRKPVVVNDMRTSGDYDYLAPHAARMLAVPMQRQERPLGCLLCFDKSNDDFSTQDIKLLHSIASQTAVFVENATLFADARGLMMGLLHSLTSAVDAKDAYTCGHSQRVALMGREIARRANLPEALCERVYMAGLLHDVGKIGVREDVLKKPGKLTPEEFEEMKQHVTIGARILRDIKQVEDLIPGVLHHHERFDGKGYPHGLGGQEIPLIARVLCVSDSFDAMTSNRTYRRALPLEVALMEIRRCAGTHFDPMLADAMLSIGVETLRSLTGNGSEQAHGGIQLLAA